MRWSTGSRIVPAELVEVEAGIRVGAPANLVLFDPDAEFVVEGAALKHRHKLTPYEGRRLHGNVMATYLRGKPATQGGGRSL